MGYKLKTNKSASKRFKLTGSGKLRFRRAERAHGNTKKTTSSLREKRRNGVMDNSNALKIKRELLHCAV